MVRTPRLARSIGFPTFMRVSECDPRRVSGDQAIGEQRLHRYRQVQTTRNGVAKRPQQLRSQIASFCETTRGTIDARVPPDTCAQQCPVPRPTKETPLQRDESLRGGLNFLIRKRGNISPSFGTIGAKRLSDKYAHQCPAPAATKAHHSCRPC